MSEDDVYVPPPEFNDPAVVRVARAIAAIPEPKFYGAVRNVPGVGNFVSDTYRTSDGIFTTGGPAGTAQKMANEHTAKLRAIAAINELRSLGWTEPS